MIHPGCFHPGICLFYRECELLISDEGIRGMGTGVQVSWPPSRFPTHFLVPHQLDWHWLESYPVPPGY